MAEMKKAEITMVCDDNTKIIYEISEIDIRIENEIQEAWVDPPPLGENATPYRLLTPGAQQRTFSGTFDNVTIWVPFWLRIRRFLRREKEEPHEQKKTDEGQKEA